MQIDWLKKARLVQVSGKLEIDAKLYNINALKLDSRTLEAGDTFCALEGTSIDAHSHIQEALDRGAHLVLGQKSQQELGLSKNAPYIQRKNLRYEISGMAASLLGQPSSKMRLFGVTGTAGKTTLVYLLESIWRQAGFKVARIGTTGICVDGWSSPAEHTTPGSIELQSLLSLFYQQGVQIVVMEVSSHAIEQGRVEAIAFESLGFTNLSPEHLDYHKNIEAYFAAKKRLFYPLASKVTQGLGLPLTRFHMARENEYSERLHQELKTHFGLNSQIAVALKKPRHSPAGFEAQDQCGSLIKCGLTGVYNQYNVELCLSMMQDAGIKKETQLEALSQFQGVPGRLEQVAPRVFIDYAHKSDALEKVLKSLKGLLPLNGKLILVFGCGGDRDRSKRPKMGAIAAEFADLVWVTSDNPRGEPPERIIQEILSGTHLTLRSHVDRRVAIEEALKEQGPLDFVLIAGKGHETYQEMRGVFLDFDDRLVVRELISSITSLPTGSPQF